jgi:glycine/D-amino acid oxidase-like deaminating enzyme
VPAGAPPTPFDPAGAWPPIAPLWGAVAEVALAEPPRHVIEEAGVEAVVAAPGAGTVPLFSLVTAKGASTLGSTFDPAEPDPAALAPALLERGARFVPALAGAAVRSARACARPQSADGRPLLGPLDGVERLHVAAGHGPWGVSTGPGSARLVADALLGRDVAIPPALAARRARWRSLRT